MLPFAASPSSPGLNFSRSDTPAVLQVPAARCASLLALVGRLGAFFNPKRRKSLRLGLTAGVSVADVGSDSDVFSVSVNYRDGNTGLSDTLASALLATVPAAEHIRPDAHRRRRPPAPRKRRLMLEILFVVTGVKPLVDVWRIPRGRNSPSPPRLGARVPGPWRLEQLEGGLATAPT
jgi:hypothetical protein